MKIKAKKSALNDNLQKTAFHLQTTTTTYLLKRHRGIRRHVILHFDKYGT